MKEKKTEALHYLLVYDTELLSMAQSPQICYSELQRAYHWMTSQFELWHRIQNKYSKFPRVKQIYVLRQIEIPVVMTGGEVLVDVCVNGTVEVCITGMVGIWTNALPLEACWKRSRMRELQFIQQNGTDIYVSDVGRIHDLFFYSRILGTILTISLSTFVLGWVILTSVEDCIWYLCINKQLN